MNTSNGLQKRNQEIYKQFEDGVHPNELAKEHGLSRSHIYTVHKQIKMGMDRFQANDTQVQNKSVVGGKLFKQLGRTGLRQFGGEVDEDYDTVFKPLESKIALYKQMADDPIAAAVLQAIKMRLRAVSWGVVAQGEKNEADKRAAKFLETCMHDMSHTWSDMLDWALDMLQDGFSPLELVYKRRSGVQVGQGGAQSKFDDGLIGWRKWLPIGADTLAPGEPWSFDEHGGIQTINQMPPTDFGSRPVINIPIEKAILFRTTAKKNNPEGRSIFRAMYNPWYFKKNLVEIEAISAERFGTGVPVIYLGRDVDKGTDSSSDFEQFSNIGDNVRVDEQMSITVGYAKMGSGAAEGEGVLIELLTPNGGKPVDLHLTITRHETRMAMVGLAQFIMLGMDRVGTQALAGTDVDFFTLSLAGWADLIEQTMHRFATERLFGLNAFPGISAIPRIVHEPIGKQDLIQLADYINKLVSVDVIKPDVELEAEVRRLMELPEPPEEDEQQVLSGEIIDSGEALDEDVKLSDKQLNGAQVTSLMSIILSFSTGELTKESARALIGAAFTSVSNEQIGRMLQRGKVESGQGEAKRKRSSKAEADEDEDAEEMTEHFQIDTRGAGRPGRKPKPIREVDAYQRRLESIYTQWSRETADLLVGTDEDERDDLIDERLAALLVLLRAEGRERLPEAFETGRGDVAPTPQMLGELAEASTSNDQFLETSLIPTIGESLRNAFADEDIALALEMGGRTGARAIESTLGKKLARVAGYAGAWWALFNQTTGRAIDEETPEDFSKPRVFWKLQQGAAHCIDCLRFGDKSYDSFEALLQETGGMFPGNLTQCSRGGNDRCELITASPLTKLEVKEGTLDKVKRIISGGV